MNIITIITLIFFTTSSLAAERGVIFHRTNETLSTIKETIVSKKKGAYLRFGDGDINLALGRNDLLQYANPKLEQELREAFLLNGPTILKCLPLYCNEFGGLEPGMFPGNHEAPYSWCLNIYNNAQLLWGAPISDVYSHAALSYASLEHLEECISFLHFLKQQNCCLLVGNKNIPVWIQERLFGNKCSFVATPDNNSYEDMDRIEQECLIKLRNTNDYKIVVVAMGCSGRALAKRLYKKIDNIFLFDFGSLMDMLCDWDTRAWISLNKDKAIKNTTIILEELKIDAVQYQ